MDEDDYNSGDDIVVAAKPQSASNGNDRSSSPSLKRKRDNDAAEVNGNDTSEHVAASTKKKSKRRKKKRKTEDDIVLADGTTLNDAIAHMDSTLMADYYSQKIRKFEKDLSFVELEDRLLPESYFVNTSSFKATRQLEKMTDFLETFCTRKGQSTISHLKSAPKLPGAPHTIVITAAGLRAADIVRQLRKYQTKESIVAKCFAKHLKLKEAVEKLQTSRVGIVVGTPARLIDLMNEGALKTKHLQRIVLDASHLDDKKRGIFDMKEVQEKVIAFLQKEDIRKRLAGGEEEDCRGVLFY